MIMVRKLSFTLNLNDDYLITSPSPKKDLSETYTLDLKAFIKRSYFISRNNKIYSFEMLLKEI